MGGGGRQGGGGGNQNILVVPQANQALQQLKYEVAQELGIQVPQDNYYAIWLLAILELSEDIWYAV